MDRALAERIGAIYLPLTAVIAARLVIGARPRQFAGTLLSLLWAACSLLVLQRCNQAAGWWSFAPGSPAELRGMPLELFVGWVILWGALPHLALPRVGILSGAAILVALDCVVMPMATATVHLGPRWMVGEAAAVAIVLLPALCAGRWTMEDRMLRGRAALQIATSAMLFLYFVPEVIFTLKPGAGWGPMFALPGPALQLAAQAVFLLALPGISAVIEFAERGGGTPIPYDPPRRLVTSGVYRYCANPMQLSCAVVMIAWAGLLRNGWMLAAAGISIAYSAGLAEWDEGDDLNRRFGGGGLEYRKQVRAWWPRWRPYHAGSEAVIYIARSCGPCSEVRAWLEASNPIGLRIVDAERLPSGTIQRVTYDPADGTGAVNGVRAIGRAMEHLHLGWMLAGALLRLPVLWRVVQLFLDAGGLGPRTAIATKSGASIAESDSLRSN